MSQMGQQLPFTALWLGSKLPVQRPEPGLLFPQPVQHRALHLLGSSPNPCGRRDSGSQLCVH